MAGLSRKPPEPPPRIGCAGWSIAAAHAHLFAAGESVLVRYVPAKQALVSAMVFNRAIAAAAGIRSLDDLP